MKRPIHIRIDNVPSLDEIKEIGRRASVRLVINELDDLIENMNECADNMEDIIDFDQPVKSKIKELRGAAKMARNWKDELSKKLEGQK